MEIKTARSLPVEAVVFDPEHPTELVDWISENSTVGKAIAQGDRLYVPTLAGTKIAAPGDYVVRDSVGDIQTYAPADYALRYKS